MEKKKRKPWSDEARARHRAACRKYAAQQKKENDFWKIISILEKTIQKGIDPVECLNLAFLVTRNKQMPLSDDLNIQAREMLLRKLPAAEIYRIMFDEPAPIAAGGMQ